MLLCKQLNESVQQMLCLGFVFLQSSCVLEQRKPLYTVQITLLFCFVKRNWKAGQPDNWGSSQGPGEDCAGLIYAGQWNDFQCDEINNFICEKEREAGKQPQAYNEAGGL